MIGRKILVVTFVVTFGLVSHRSRQQLNKWYSWQLSNLRSSRHRALLAFPTYDGIASAHLVRTQPQKSINSPYIKDHLDGAVVASRRIQSERMEIRYLAFGTSITWGAGLQDRNNAYPFLLSPTAKNAAIRCTGPSYPSLCAETLAGDDGIFDVIVLEFHHKGDALLHLARRLRQRFPEAIIIIYENWQPLTIVDAENQNVKVWAANEGHGDLHSESFQEAFSKSDNNWQWAGVGGHDVRLETVREVGGFHLVLPKPDDPRDFIKYANFFAPDWHHLSEKGHEFIASKVREIVASANIVSNPRLGPWGHRDSCLSWFENGEDPFEHSPNIEMEMFHSEHKKFALRIPQEGGSMVVHNPSDAPLELYFTYMVTGPSHRKYPNTEVSIMDASSSPVVLDTSAPQWFVHPVHVSTTKKVGTVFPGENTVTFRPLEVTLYPFRLVSTILTNYQGVDVDGRHFRADIAVSRTSDE